MPAPFCDVTGLFCYSLLLYLQNDRSFIVANTETTATFISKELGFANAVFPNYAASRGLSGYVLWFLNVYIRPTCFRLLSISIISPTAWLCLN